MSYAYPSSYFIEVSCGYANLTKLSNMKKSTAFLLLLLLIVLNFSCKKEELPKREALCDLLSATLLPAAGVLIDVDISIVSSVYNLPDLSVDCTGDAGASNSNFGVEFREDENQDWQVIEDVSNQILLVPSLVAGAAGHDIEVTMNFNMPGQYRFQTATDYDFKVEERDEVNNGSCVGCLLIGVSGNNVSYSEVLTVYENPNIPIDYSKPMVEIVSIR